MLSVTYLHDGPLGPGPGAVRLPAVPSLDDYRLAPSGQGPLAAEWADKPHRLLYELCARIEGSTRVVSSVVDLPEETCPTCGGGPPGCYANDHDEPGYCDCSTCGGKGKIRRLWHAVEQENVADETVVGGHWLDASATTPADAERRLVVVGWSDTQTLPVLGAEERLDEAWKPHIARTKNRGQRLHLWHGPDVARGESLSTGRAVWKLTDIDDEPWAQGLVPGDRVLSWENVVMLDTPIDLMTCPVCSKRSEWCGYDGSDDDGVYDGRPDCSAGLVPLQLKPGLNIIELAA